VADLRLQNSVLLMGPYTPIETEWAKGAIAAVPSDRESFGMTLVEAMRCGVPVVSTNAPNGPAEILQHGVDGLLTPVGDPDAMAAALLRLINDDAEREAMAAAALQNSARYDPAVIAEQYEQLFERLAARKAARRRWFRRDRSPGVPEPVLGPAPTATLPVVDVTAGEPVTGDYVWRRGQQRVPAGGPLADGDWQLFTTAGEPVRAGRLDTRALIPGPVGVALPYRSENGLLMLRVRDRPVYAEVGDVRIGGDGIGFDVRLVGAESRAPVVEARSAEVTRELPGLPARVPVLPAGTWELWLRHDPDRPAVRLGRHLDEVARKDVAYGFPAATVGGVTMQPHYDRENNFAIRVTG
jgi:hypothetical protein